MSEDRKEQLYRILFDVLGELTEHESPELIFDRIVEDFASSAEYHMGQADTFKCMLDTFRHDNPVETIPEDTIILPDGISDINRQYMLEDLDIAEVTQEFMKNLSDPT